LIVTSTDAGATVGPNLVLYRNSASPAASDVLGEVRFDGEDDAGNTQTYASINASIVDATSTSEDGSLNFATVVAGTSATRGYVRIGMVMGSASGGDQGAGTINAAALYDDGVQVFPSFPMAGALGLVVQNNSGTPNSQMDIDASYVVMTDSSNRPFTATSVDLTVNCATTGANGLDAGSLANATWYYFFIISNGSATAGLASTSATSPTMPSGYTYKVRVGACVTNGSAQFYRIIQNGRTAAYNIQTSGTTTVLPIIGNGVSGTYSTTSPVLTALGVTGVAPPTARVINIAVTNVYQNGSTSDVLVAPSSNWGGTNRGPQGSSGQTYPVQIVQTAADSVSASINLVGSSIGYAANQAGGAVSCIGWTDSVNA